MGASVGISRALADNIISLINNAAESAPHITTLSRMRLACTAILLAPPYRRGYQTWRRRLRMAAVETSALLAHFDNRWQNRQTYRAWQSVSSNRRRRRASDGLKRVGLDGTGISRTLALLSRGRVRGTAHGGRRARMVRNRGGNALRALLHRHHRCCTRVPHLSLRIALHTWLRDAHLLFLWCGLGCAALSFSLLHFLFAAACGGVATNGGWRRRPRYKPWNGTQNITGADKIQASDNGSG